MSSWRTLLLRIGDKCPEYGGTSDFKDHIETCYGVLSRELDHSKDDILAFLIQCAEQLPHKIPLYGTVVGLLNLENEDFARNVVEHTQTNLQDALHSGNCNRIRILMRFLTVLMCSKVLQAGSIIVVFETLLSSAATTVDEENGNPSWQVRADFYITCILSCLPWGGAELIEQIPEEIERVMVGIEAYLSIRKRGCDSGFSAFVFDDESEKAHSEKDFLEDLWDRIQALSSNGWKLESVPRPHLSFEAQLVAGKSHDLGPISCPEQPAPPPALSGITCGRQKHEAELMYPQRLRRLNIFPASKIEGQQPIDRFIVEEYLLDVLFFFNGCRKECASFLVGLPVPFRYEYLMAETIFSQLLLLPQPPFKPIYYTLVIIDLCKALPGAFPPVVAGAVRALFERIADLDMECRTRLILWFSHHLSNFQFIWPWEEWAYVLELPKWAPQRVFVQEVLEREVRLSYWEQIKQSIENAPTLEELLPPKSGPNFKYSAEDGSEAHAFSAQLSSMVKEKVTSRDIISWVEENIIPVHGLTVALEVVLQTFLDIGSKSFTHLITVLERYGQVIAKLWPDLDKQVMLIDEVSLYWKNNAQMKAITIDRMMGYRLISNLAIVNWVFSPPNVEQFHTSDCPWEKCEMCPGEDPKCPGSSQPGSAAGLMLVGLLMSRKRECYLCNLKIGLVQEANKTINMILRNALDKTYNRISDLRKEILSLENVVLLAEEVTAKAKADLEAAETKLTVVNGEPVLGENPARMKRLKSYAEKAKEDEVSVRDSLEAKTALLTRALEENEALFVSLYKSFSNVLMERLHHASLDEKKGVVWSDQIETMAVDSEEPSAMEVDNENGRPEKSQGNGERTINGYKIGENQQWCLSTLGYVKAFSRQYATEIWPHIEKLDFEVFTDIHPLFRKAVYSGLHRPIHEG